jgi:hypothetical protein
MKLPMSIRVLGFAAALALVSCSDAEGVPPGAPSASPAPPPPASTPTPKPVAVATPRAHACDPPYTVDPVSGRKRYKIECLNIE